MDDSAAGKPFDGSRAVGPPRHGAHCRRYGQGFATALREIGLPQTELPTALLFFNVGVELGQLAFAAMLLAAAELGHRVAKRLNAVFSVALGWRAHRVKLAGVYAVGALAAFWTIERVSGFWV